MHKYLKLGLFVVLGLAIGLFVQTYWVANSANRSTGA